MRELPITKFALGSSEYNIDFSASSRNLLVCDFPAMRTIGLAEKPALILGHDFLHADYNNNGEESDADVSTDTARVGVDGLRRKNLVFDPVQDHLYLDS